MNRSGPAGMGGETLLGREGRPAHTWGMVEGEGCCQQRREVGEEKWGDVCSVESSPERTGRPAGKRGSGTSQPGWNLTF